MRLSNMHANIIIAGFLIENIVFRVLCSPFFTNFSMMINLSQKFPLLISNLKLEIFFSSERGGGLKMSQKFTLKAVNKLEIKSENFRQIYPFWFVPENLQIIHQSESLYKQSMISKQQILFMFFVWIYVCCCFQLNNINILETQYK